jgi:WD40 repeat protein
VTLPLKRLREEGDQTRVVLLIDALDESLTSPAADALPRLLGGVDYVHLVVTARNDSRAVGGLRERAQVIDLADAPPGSDDVLAYLHHRLRPHGTPAAMKVLAGRIATAADGNFLYARYVVDALIEAGELGGIDTSAAQQIRLPQGGLGGVYQEFLQRQLGSDHRAWTERFRPVMAALAVAQDEGLDTNQLIRITSHLCERPLSRTAVRDVTGAARPFLDGAPPDGPFRIYHQSFAGFLVDVDDNPDFLIDPVEAHTAIVAAYRPSDPLTWDRYARRNLAVHEAAAGQLDVMLGDTRFLLAADPDRLLPLLAVAGREDAIRTARVYLSAFRQIRGRPAGEAAAYLELHARQAGYAEVANQVAGAGLNQPWSVPWARWQPVHARQTIGRHDGQVSVVAVGELDGRPIVVSGGDATLRVWELDTGQQRGKPLRGHEGNRPYAPSEVAALALGELDGRPIVVSGGGDATVRVWELRTGQQLGEPLRGHEGRVSAVAVGELDGRPIVVSGGDDATVRVWELDTGQQLGEPLRGHEGNPSYGGGVFRVAVGELDGRPIAVSGGGDATVRVWDLAEGRPLGKPLRGHDGGVFTVAVGELDGRPIAVSGGGDDAVRVWDLAKGRPLGKPLRGHDGTVYTVAIAEVDGQPVVISGGASGIQMWDLAKGRPLGKLLHGQQPERSHRVDAVAVGTWAGRTVVVSCGLDGTVQAWDLTTRESLTKPLSGHKGFVNAVAVGELDGYPIVVSGGDDNIVRIWKLSDLESGVVEIGSTVRALALTSTGTIVVGAHMGLMTLSLNLHSPDWAESRSSLA